MKKESSPILVCISLFGRAINPSSLIVNLLVLNVYFVSESFPFPIKADSKNFLVLFNWKSCVLHLDASLNIVAANKPYWLISVLREKCTKFLEIKSRSTQDVFFL